MTVTIGLGVCVVMLISRVGLPLTLHTFIAFLNSKLYESTEASHFEFPCKTATRHNKAHTKSDLAHADAHDDTLCNIQTIVQLTGKSSAGCMCFGSS